MSLPSLLRRLAAKGRAARRLPRAPCRIFAGFALALLAPAATPETAAEETPGQGAGLTVYLGESDRPNLAALAGEGLASALDREPERAAQVRERLAESGRYGQVTVEHWTGGPLPHGDDLAARLLVDGAGASWCPPSEWHRILQPGGRLLAAADASGGDLEERLRGAGFAELRRSGGWLEARKPRRAELDEWTHERHSAAGNPVSRDRIVAPPQHLRWVSGNLEDGARMLSAGGRNFYTGVGKLYRHDRLVARDAFTGLPLWEAPVSSLVWPVATAERVYAVDPEDRLVVLDADDGREMGSFETAAAPVHLLHEGGVLYVSSATSLEAFPAGGAEGPDSSGPLWRYESSLIQNAIVAGGRVFLVSGHPRRGEEEAVVALDAATGETLWTREDLPWAGRSRYASYDRGLVAFEVSSFNNDAEGNAVHVLRASDGALVAESEFAPGMAHYRQARAIFARGALWMQHGGRLTRLAFDEDGAPGEMEDVARCGVNRCYPPLATERYYVAGVMEMIDLEKGETVSHPQITKGVCRTGYLPANGMWYSCPKLCVCFPMFEGYVALAASHRTTFALEDGEAEAAAAVVPPPGGRAFVRGPAEAPPEDAPPESAPADWPLYRADMWRSGSTPSEVPEKPALLWRAEAPPLDAPALLRRDWRSNPYLKSDLTPPVVAGGLVYVAQGDAHRVLAFDFETGELRWSATVDGRIDSPPAIHRGLCLVGTRSGWIHCLRADDGELVWKMRAAPLERRIVAYGQLESSWPVAGSVLVDGDTAYAAAGRHPLVDGGFRVTAFDPRSGYVLWETSGTDGDAAWLRNREGTDFDYCDLLVRDGDRIALSRWRYDPADGAVELDRASGFLRAGETPVYMPRNTWSYGPPGNRLRSLRPLAVFRGASLYGGGKQLFRRDFAPGETIDEEWLHEPTLKARYNETYPEPIRHLEAVQAIDWLGHGHSVWTAPPPEEIRAMVLAGGTLLLAAGGELLARDASDGSPRWSVPAGETVWDGMAVARGRVFLSTEAGEVLCLGAP